VVLLRPGALAATPPEIRADYADNGRLDQQYRRADLERALRDATLETRCGTLVTPH
jgi:hypothetical protein